MPKEVVGNIPEFTADESTEESEEVKPGEEKTPSESSTEDKPAESTEETEETEVEKTEETEESEEEEGEDTTETDEIDSETQGLVDQRNKLLKEIIDLRGDRRKLKEKALEKVDQQIEVKVDELKDVNPEDLKIIDKILKARGYVSKTDLDKTIYNQVKQQELDRFVERYPEFKPENDPEDKNWTALQEELKYYKLPDNSAGIKKILEKARQAISSTVPLSGRATAKANQKKLDTAGKGSGGKAGGQRPSSLGSFDPQQVDALRRGGFTEEEVLKYLTKLEQQE